MTRTTTHDDDGFHVRGGFLVRTDTPAETAARFRARTLDASRDGNYSRIQKSFGDDLGDPEEDDVIEVHNHIAESPDYGAFTSGTNDPDAMDKKRRGRRGRDEDYPDQGQEVCRLNKDECNVVCEGNEIVVYRTNGSNGDENFGTNGKSVHPDTDIYDFDVTGDKRARDSRSRARDSRSGPPRTLAQINAANRAHYAAKGGRR
jgi:hypothetical protein